MYWIILAILASSGSTNMCDYYFNDDLAQVEIKFSSKWEYWKAKNSCIEFQKQTQERQEKFGDKY